MDYTVGYSLGALGLLTVATTAYLAFRPEHPAARLTADDEAQLRELLARHGGRDSLGYFALRRDKASSCPRPARPPSATAWSPA